MSLALRHVAVPALGSLALVALYFTPLSVVSCTNRGLLALTITGISTVGAFVCVAVAFRRRARGDASSAWWVLSTAILALPLALLLGPLG